MSFFSLERLSQRLDVFLVEIRFDDPSPERLDPGHEFGQGFILAYQDQSRRVIGQGGCEFVQPRIIERHLIAGS